jgi:hypothetical protein
MSVNAFMGNIELLPVAVKQRPDFIPGKIFAGLFIGFIFGDSH